MAESTTRSLGSHYRLGDLLGRGAMGEVYVAEDVDTGERLAAKILRADHSDDDEVTARFLQERKLLRELTHPNIVRVRELVVDRDEIAIVMDLVEGEDLRKHLRRNGRLRPAEAVRICSDILAALSMAHSLTPPVQHRDVKPDNVLLADSDASRVYLTDFGVARLAEVGTSVRLTSGVGTADYMAPEMTGASAGAPADVYAVGVMLYELLAGHPPFGKGSFQEIALRHVTCLPPPLPGLDPDLAANLEALLVKNPASRPSAATAETRLRALLPILEGKEALAPVAVPTQWRQVAGGFAGAVAATVDDAALTDIKGAPRVSTTGLPVAGLDVAAGVRRDGLLGQEEATRLGSVEAYERDRSVAAPVVATPTPIAEKQRSRTLIVLASVAGGAVLLGGGYLVMSATSGGSRTDNGATGAVNPRSTTPVIDEAPVVPVSIARTAAYDGGTVTITYQITNGGGPLKAPLLEVLPATEGSGCAPVDASSWTGIEAAADAAEFACAWKLTPPADGFGRSASYTVEVPWSGALKDGALDTYLSDIQAQTAAGMKVVDPTTFAVQGLSSAPTLELTSGARAGKVLPLVLSGEFGTKKAALYASGPNTGNALTALGKQLFGSVTFSSSGCTDFDGTPPMVGAWSTGCSISVNLPGYQGEPPSTGEIEVSAS
ncbi:MAG: serine/threonine-protein kinase [Nocardioidaceae bacterium]